MVQHIVRQEEPAGGQTPDHQVQVGWIVRLVGIDVHQIEVTFQTRYHIQRSAAVAADPFLHACQYEMLVADRLQPRIDIHRMDVAFGVQSLRQTEGSVSGVGAQLQHTAWSGQAAQERQQSALHRAAEHMRRMGTGTGSARQSVQVGRFRRTMAFRIHRERGRCGIHGAKVKVTVVTVALGTICHLLSSTRREPSVRTMYRTLLTAVILVACTAQAQWQHVGHPNTTPAGDLQWVDDSLYYMPTNHTGRIFRSGDLGQTWQERIFNPIGHAQQFLRHSGTDYLSYYNGSGGVRLWRWSRADRQWQQKYLSVEHVALRPSGRLVILSGVSPENRPIRISDDRGDTWTTTFRSSGAIRFRYVGEDSQGRLLVQTYDWDNAPADSLGLWRSADDGSSWTRINAITHNLSGAHCSIDGHIYCSNGRRILHSADDGVSWDTPWTVTFPHSGFTGSRLYRLADGRVYFMRGFDSGLVQYDDPVNLYVSNDGAHTWTAVAGEVNTHMSWSMLQVPQGSLFLASDSGVYSSSTPMRVEALPGRMELQVYPNPTHDRVLVDAGDAVLSEIRLFDMAAREVRVIGGLRSGQASIQLGGLPAGVFLLRAITDRGTLTTRVVVE